MGEGGERGKEGGEREKEEKKKENCREGDGIKGSIRGPRGPKKCGGAPKLTAQVCKPPFAKSFDVIGKHPTAYKPSGT